MSAHPAPADLPGRGALAAPRSRYVPKRHPGRPRRWNRESILEALRAWAAQTGSPPRRQDWSGERPDAARLAQRKWMLEHPRWPSSSCVAAHFGSWGEALRASGLPARSMRFDDPLSERVAVARRLGAEGQTIAAIAQQLGVSRSTAHNYLRAHPCPQCGGPVPSPRASRCISCTANEPTIERCWTQGAVREAIRAWTDEHGQAPSHRAWTPSRLQPGEWEAESPRWPSAAVVCDLYREHPDPWNAALLDAGASVRIRRWSDDAIRAVLAGFWTRTGHRPSIADVQSPKWEGPSGRTLRRRYGSLERAWQALGPVPAA